MTVGKVRLVYDGIDRDSEKTMGETADQIYNRTGITRP
jgi:hypothetical protein